MIALFYFALLSHIENISVVTVKEIWRRHVMQQIVEGAASNNRVYLRESETRWHAEYRLPCSQRIKKKLHAILNKDIYTIRKNSLE